MNGWRSLFVVKAFWPFSVMARSPLAWWEQMLKLFQLFSYEFAVAKSCKTFLDNWAELAEIFFVAKPSQNQLSHKRNSVLDRCGILFYARSGTVVYIPKSVETENSLLIWINVQVTVWSNNTNQQFEKGLFCSPSIRQWRGCYWITIHQSDVNILWNWPTRYICWR
jgi:hypothetical protein